MSRFRASLFDRKRTRWRSTREEAIEDAVANGWAARDEYVATRIFYSVGVKIEEDPETKKGGTPKRPPSRTFKR
jgi:hypothetical protein